MAIKKRTSKERETTPEPQKSQVSSTPAKKQRVVLYSAGGISHEGNKATFVRPIVETET